MKKALNAICFLIMTVPFSQALAVPVFFDVLFDTDTVDGGGVITADSSILLPNATIFGNQMTIDLEFNGVDFNTIFNPAGEGLILDNLGFNFIGTTNAGSLFEFLDQASFTSILALPNGALPTTFIASGTVGGFEGEFSIERRTSDVPEPSVLILMSLGMIGFVVRRRKIQA